jgi:catechol 2,3-dioxygenase-like lactoylglutathione lyase family enzyme
MIKGLAHVGLSVASLERSIDFYRQCLDMQVLEVEEFGGPQYDAVMRLANARGRLAILQTTGLQLELFEFYSPTPRPALVGRPVCDHGITHFCIEVTDVDGVCEKLRTAGGTLHSNPVLFFGTTRATYARDLDDNVFEVFETIAGPSA